jgi:hypothetical protein
MIGAWSLAAAVAMTPPAPHLNATRVDKSPILDGKLDDPAWATLAASLKTPISSAVCST